LELLQLFQEVQLKLERDEYVTISRFSFSAKQLMVTIYEVLFQQENLPDKLRGL
jgi:hypothetical protein